MNKVSVCIMLNDDYYGTIYSFEKSGFAVIEKKSETFVKDEPKKYVNVIGVFEVELLVFATPKTDKRLLEYFVKIANVIDEYSAPVKDATAYNNLFKKAQSEYICIFNPYVFLQQHWLIELIYYHSTISKSGVVGICTDFADVEFVPKLSPLPQHPQAENQRDTETFVNVFVPTNNLINDAGVCLFLREHLFYVGAFDESELLYKNELNQFQLRSLALGLTNYYIPTQTCLINNKYSETADNTGKENLLKSIAEMKKNKNYYIQLTQ